MSGVVRAATLSLALLVAGAASTAAAGAAEAPAGSTTVPVSTTFVPPQGTPETAPTTVAPPLPDEEQGRVLPIFVVLSIGGFAVALLIVVAQAIATRPRRTPPASP